MKTRHAGHVFGLLALGATACGFASENGDGEEVGSTASALTTSYQAENAFDIEEGVVENINAGYTGTGYVNVDNAIDSRIWNIVSSPVAGPVTLRVRYANGTTTARPIQISANGTNGPVLSGAPTGSWSTWTTAAGTVNLLAGNNDVFFQSTVASGLPNIDSFEIAQTFTQTFQAEAAFDIEEGVVETIHAGFTGTGYVNIDNFTGTFIWHVINSPASAPVSLRLRYANGTGVARPIQVSVNGSGEALIPGAPTGSWSTWATRTVTVNLLAGNNDVFLMSVSSDGMPNIDKYDITW
jgi:hypothetical protein